jgi:cytoplasmic iron level regulating protein YaaA (DUF328/UPF0246 family)
VERTDLVVLIPESTRKRKGGDPYTKMVDGFAEDLPKAEHDRLFALRAEVASSWKNDAARDGVMPAYRRFDGNMYRRIQEDAWEKRKGNVEVLIASALYGLLASRDTIFAYPHSMAEATPPFGKLNRWWHGQGLPAILAAYVKNVRPKTVVDLLSHEYREAVEGYEANLGTIAVKAIDFPGMGRTSQPLRGEKVAAILRNGKA